MKSIKLTKDGDIELDIKLIEGRQELIQSVFVCLSVGIREWFLDTEFGLDTQKLKGKSKTQEEMKWAIRTALLKETRIKEVYLKDVIIENKEKRSVLIVGYFTDENNIRVQLEDLGVIEY